MVGDRRVVTVAGALLACFASAWGDDHGARPRPPPRAQPLRLRLQYVGGVVQYFPNKRFMTGVEYLFGQRENRTGDTGSDNRVQVSTMVKF